MEREPSDHGSVAGVSVGKVETVHHLIDEGSLGEGDSACSMITGEGYTECEFGRAEFGYLLPGFEQFHKLVILGS